MLGMQRMAVVVIAFSMTLGVRAQGSVGTDEDAVRAVALHETEGWSKFDPAEIASCYTVDTTWQNPFGVRLHSRVDLQKFLAKLFQRPGYRSATETMAPRITDIHILSATSAVVWLEEKSEGQVDDATGKQMKPRFSHTVEVFTKKDGAWLISDSMIMDEYPRP
jgi:uncharacterized protein (TIGR02246 family)